MAKEIATLGVRMDAELKEQFDEVVTAMGLSMSSAVTMFVAKVVSEQRIPLNLDLNETKAVKAKQAKRRKEVRL